MARRRAGLGVEVVGGGNGQVGRGCCERTVGVVDGRREEDGQRGDLRRARLRGVGVVHGRARSVVGGAGARIGLVVAVDGLAGG